MEKRQKQNNPIEQYGILLAPGDKTEPKTQALCWNVGATHFVFLQKPEGFNPYRRVLGSKYRRDVGTSPKVPACDLFTQPCAIYRLSQILGSVTEGYPKQKDTNKAYTQKTY